MRRTELPFVAAIGDNVRYRLAEMLVQQSVICERVADLVLRYGAECNVLFEYRAEASPFAVTVTDDKLIVCHAIKKVFDRFVDAWIIAHAVCLFAHASSSMSRYLCFRSSLSSSRYLLIRFRTG